MKHAPVNMMLLWKARTVYGRGMARKLAPSAYLEPVSSTAARRNLVNAFGTPRAQNWCMPASGTEAGLRAARLQHDLAKQFREAINASEAGNLAEFTRRHPVFTYDRLRGILAGDVWMRLEDIAELSELLGLHVQVSL
jgi:hypothetical protein